jgi:hypothetical protein
MRNMPTHEEEPWEHDRRRLGDSRANAIWEQRRAQLGLAPRRRSRRMIVIVTSGLTLSFVIVLLSLPSRQGIDAPRAGSVHRHAHRAETRHHHRHAYRAVPGHP